MTVFETYRQYADAQRSLAAMSSLPNRRTMHERCAETWEAMAVNAEQTADLAVVNAAAKAAT